ncbi:hypothetical protein [Nocardia sp. NPDC005745]|uniref:hypothetical protein n=1 Tax=Nocardia sp. NPDC005745 TaxID=3157061 RepID=UPI0033F732F0
MSPDPWTVTSPSDGVYRFTNASDAKAVMITLHPIGNVELKAVGDGEFDDQAVSTPKDPGQSFDRKIKRATSVGTAGVRVTWTTPGVGHSSWDFKLPE